MDSNLNVNAIARKPIEGFKDIRVYLVIVSYTFLK